MLEFIMENRVGDVSVKYRNLNSGGFAYIVEPRDFVLFRIRANVALEIDVVAFLDVLRIKGVA